MIELYFWFVSIVISFLIGFFIGGFMMKLTGNKIK